MKYIQYLDILTPKVQIPLEGSVYRSRNKKGALISISIIFCAIAYMLYQIIIWVRGDFQPFISKQQVVDENVTFNLFNLDLKLKVTNLLKWQLELIQENIHIKIQNSTLVEGEYVIYYLNVEKYQKELDEHFQIKSFKEILDNISVQIVICDENSKCTDPMILQTLFLTQMIVEILLPYQTINQHNHEIIQINKNLQYPLIKGSITLGFAKLNIENTEIDYGYPLKIKKTNKKIMADFKSSLFQFDQNQNIIFQSKGMIAILFFSCQPITTNLIIQHQNILDIIILSISLMKILLTIAAFSMDTQIVYKQQFKKYTQLTQNQDCQSFKEIEISSIKDIIISINLLKQQQQKLLEKIELIGQDLEKEVQKTNQIKNIIEPDKNENVNEFQLVRNQLKQKDQEQKIEKQIREEDIQNYEDYDYYNLDYLSPQILRYHNNFQQTQNDDAIIKR